MTDDLENHELTALANDDEGVAYWECDGGGALGNEPCPSCGSAAHEPCRDSYAAAIARGLDSLRVFAAVDTEPSVSVLFQRDGRQGGVPAWSVFRDEEHIGDLWRTRDGWRFDSHDDDIPGADLHDCRDARAAKAAVAARLTKETA